MKLSMAIMTVSLLLPACQSDADKIKFYHQGYAYLLGTSLCIGTVKKSDVIRYYYLEALRRGGNIEKLSSGNAPVALRYPNNCFAVTLEIGQRYGILYTMNDKKYNARFIVSTDGGIIILPRSR